MTISKSHAFFVCLLLVPLYPLGSIQMGVLLHYVAVCTFAVFFFLPKDQRVFLPHSVAILIALYFMPNVVRIFFQEVRFDLVNSILRDLICFLTFIISYNVFANQDLQKLRRVLKTLIGVTVGFVILQILPGTYSILSHWNPRGVQGFYGVQIGSLFVFSYSFGVFILLSSIVLGKVKFLSVVLIALTQSKSIFLAFLGISLLRMKLRSLPIYLGVLFTVGFLYYDTILQRLPYLYFLIDTWASGEIDPSTQYRLIQAQIAVNSVLDGPFWGNPTSDVNIENLYLYTLNEYGLLGATLRLVVAFLVVLETCGRGVLSRSERMQILLVILFAGLSFPVLEAPKISLLIWALFGALYRISQERS
ncbi:hypothetical protein [Shimia sp.]|uniref:hypothetical protein n=1 Tax=Shimia sp. TaxID=1954381 RepID=UPI003BAA2BAA